jgi:hypothetical protein
LKVVVPVFVLRSHEASFVAAVDRTEVCRWCCVPHSTHGPAREATAFAERPMAHTLATNDRLHPGKEEDEEVITIIDDDQEKQIAELRRSLMKRKRVEYVSCAPSSRSFPFGVCSRRLFLDAAEVSRGPTTAVLAFLHSPLTSNPAFDLQTVSRLKNPRASPQLVDCAPA